MLTSNFRVASRQLLCSLTLLKRRKLFSSATFDTLLWMMASNQLSPPGDRLRNALFHVAGVTQPAHHGPWPTRPPQLLCAPRYTLGCELHRQSNYFAEIWENFHGNRGCLVTVWKNERLKTWKETKELEGQRLQTDFLRSLLFYICRYLHFLWNFFSVIEDHILLSNFLKIESSPSYAYDAYDFAYDFL